MFLLTIFLLGLSLLWPGMKVKGAVKNFCPVQETEYFDEDEDKTMKVSQRKESIQKLSPVLVQRIHITFTYTLRSGQYMQ